MPRNLVTVTYRFIFPDGKEKTFNLNFDDETAAQPGPGEENYPAWTTLATCDGVGPDLDAPLPGWTDLSFHQCPNCPLSPLKTKSCPLVSSLAQVVAFFSSIVSYTEVEVEVTTPERTISNRTQVQHALSSLLGLLQATSGCPQMAFFRPMARFHLPFATPRESLFRATTTYLMSQYFAQQDGKPVEWSFDGLIEHYRNIEVVNRHVARRLTAAIDEDASVNAVILLDLLAKLIPDAVEMSLEELRPLFATYLDQLPQAPPMSNAA